MLNEIAKLLEDWGIKHVLAGDVVLVDRDSMVNLFSNFREEEAYEAVRVNIAASFDTPIVWGKLDDNWYYVQGR